MQGIMHKINRGTLLRWSWIALVTGLCLWPMPAVMADEQWGRLGYLIVTPLLTLCCFAKSRRHWQLLYPALLAVTWSILLPMAYTLLLSFSNLRDPYTTYGSSEPHLLTIKQVKTQLLGQTRRLEAQYLLTLYQDAAGKYTLSLTNPDNSAERYHSTPSDLKSMTRQEAPTLELQRGSADQPGRECDIKELIELRKVLHALILRLPSEGNPAPVYLQHEGLRKYAAFTASYLSVADGSDALFETQTGDQDKAVHYAPNRDRGYYQPIDRHGQFYGEAIGPGFFDFSPHYLWQHIKDLNKPIDPYDNTGSPQLFGSKLPDWLIALPWLHTLLWSLGYGLVCLTISSALATLNAFCLQGQGKSLSWLKLLVLPAAIPLAFQTLIYKGLLKHNYGELYVLLSQLIGKETRYSHFLEYSFFISLSLLISTILALIPLLTLWFSRLTTELHTMPLLTFTKQLLLRSRSTLLLLLAVLMLAQPFYEFTKGEPSYQVGNGLYAMGLTDTLGTISYPIALRGGSGQHYGLASTLLLLIFPISLLLGWWRYKALQQQAPLPQSLITEPAPPKLTGHLLPRLWLGAMALLLWLPLLLLMFVSLRQGQFADLEMGESVWSILPVEFTLDHFKSAFDMTIYYQDGTFLTPPFPFMQWLGNSLRYASSMTLLTLAIALPAAWALARYQFAARQSLYRLGIILQTMMPSLLLLAIYLLWSTPTRKNDLLPDALPALLMANAGIVLLAIFPLTVALQQQTRMLSLKESLIRLRPLLLTLSGLLFLQQMGENTFSLIPDYQQLTLAHVVDTYLYPNTYLWGDFTAAIVVLAVPLMALFYWLVPRIDRNLINHWRPM